MKQIVLFAATAFFTSCSAIKGVSGRIVTGAGDYVIHPDGRVEIVVNTQSAR